MSNWRTYKIIACSVFLQALFVCLWAQIEADYCLPLRLEPALAGNFGELRSSHFHAGLDFKTQSTVDHPVYAFADGYVHRADINAYGYGIVLYVRHPQLGLTSVYGHLNSFDDYIYNKVRARQQELELNNPQLTFAPGEIPVKKGQVIAKSGNTGSSGGPHVHFELRDCNDDDDEFFNPMPFFRSKIADHKAPQASHVYLYPLGGVACGQRTRQSAAVITSQSGKKTTNRQFTAWGRVGLGLKAYDYMENQGNKYGVYSVRLFMDDKLIYEMRQDRFRFSERRFTNSLTDFEAWVSQKSMIMKSFIEPGNKLRMLSHEFGDGTVTIDEERTYRFRYELADAHDNKSQVEFTIKGKHSPLPDGGVLSLALPAGTRTDKGLIVRCHEPLAYDSLGFSLRVDADNFYTDLVLPFSVSRPSPEQHKGVVSDIYVLGKQTIPVHGYFDMTLPLPKAYTDTLSNPQQLYVVNTDGGYIGGKYESGSMKLHIREFGHFAVRRDASRPTASIVSMGWNKAEISVADNGSGVAQYKVFIDGKFVPFDQNRYNRRLAEPRKFGIEKGRNHDIRIWVIDRCGNETTIETKKYF